MNKRHWYYPALLCLLVSKPAFTNPDSTNTAVWLAFSVQDFDYEEFFDDGAVANREEGLIPGFNVGLSNTQDRFFVETRLSAWSGRVGYRGPVDTITDENLLDWAVAAGAELYRHGSIGVAWYAGAGYRYWERDILSTATANGLFEIYEWGYGMLGMRARYGFSEATQLGADIQLMRPFDPKIQVEFKAGFDDKELGLGEKTGVRVALTLENQVDRNAKFLISPWFEYWELGRSPTEPLLQDGIAVGSVFEPMSEARNFGITIGLVWQL